MRKLLLLILLSLIISVNVIAQSKSDIAYTLVNTPADDFKLSMVESLSNDDVKIKEILEFRDNDYRKEFAKIENVKLRNQLVNRLSPHDRAELWRANLIIVLASENLSLAQQQLIVRFSRALNASWFTQDWTNETAPSDIKSFRLEIIESFTQAQLPIFGEINYDGTGTVSCTAPIPAKYIKAGFTSTVCNCLVGSFFNFSCDSTCDSGTTIGGNPLCQPAYGCGLLGVFTCNGWCYVAPPKNRV